MTTEDIEKTIEASGYNMVVFGLKTFPKDLCPRYVSTYGTAVRYAPRKVICEDGDTFVAGWTSTDYSYEDVKEFCKILITTFPEFMLNKRRRLLKALKDFR